MVDVFRYQTESGKEPLTDWLQSIRDKQAQAKIRIRIKRLEAGNFGDCYPVGEGVIEYLQPKAVLPPAFGMLSDLKRVE